MIECKGYLIHARAYKNTSQIVYLLTESQGMIHAIAKGSQSVKSKFKGNLVPFRPLNLAYIGKSSLKQLVQAECVTPVKIENYLSHISMLYLNELIYYLNFDEVQIMAIYPAYQKIIKQLCQSNKVSLILRNFELLLCKISGHELIIPHGISPHSNIRFSPNDGIVIDKKQSFCTLCALEKFINEGEISVETSKQVNWFMRKVIDHLVLGKKIKSRELW